MPAFPRHQLETDYMLFGGCCAYCRRPLEILEVDHVVAQADGGSDDEINTVLACRRCNSAKGQVSGLLRDPVTGSLARMFHPKKDTWAEHFEQRNGAIFGRTSVGRATAAILFRPLPRDAPRAVWPPLSYCSDPTLSAQINLLLASHNQSDFRAVDRQLVSLAKRAGLSNAADRWVQSYALKYFWATARFERALPIDIRQNLHAALSNYARGPLAGAPVEHEERLRFEWLGIAAIQAADYAASCGATDTTARLQLLIARLYGRFSRNPAFSVEGFEWRSVARHVARAQISLPSIDPYLDEIAVQREQNRFQLLCDIADAAAASPNVSTAALERVTSLVDDAMSVAGYAAGGDLAESIGLRRRWWTLRSRLDMDTEWSAMSWDIDYWRRTGMHHELRTLQSEIGHQVRLMDD
jgi:hypothetical protein